MSKNSSQKRNNVNELRSFSTLFTYKISLLLQIFYEPCFSSVNCKSKNQLICFQGGEDGNFFPLGSDAGLKVGTILLEKHAVSIFRAGDGQNVSKTKSTRRHNTEK